MDVKVDGAIFVALSERNLRDLLGQFEDGGYGQLVRRNEDGVVIHVRVENDLEHYGDRVPGPGSQR